MNYMVVIEPDFGDVSPTRMEIKGFTFYIMDEVCYVEDKIGRLMFTLSMPKGMIPAMIIKPAWWDKIGREKLKAMYGGGAVVVIEPGRGFGKTALLEALKEGKIPPVVVLAEESKSLGTVLSNAPEPFILRDIPRTEVIAVIENKRRRHNKRDKYKPKKYH